MATKVYTEKVIGLQDEDDTEVVIRPLPIGRLRRFMEAWAKSSEVKDGEDGFEIFINCCGIALEHNFKGKYQIKASSAEQEKGEFLGEDYKEYLFDTLDLDTIYEILDVAGGINLRDPKLLEIAAAAQKETKE